jgi:hypothetical protein
MSPPPMPIDYVAGAGYGDAGPSSVAAAVSHSLATDGVALLEWAPLALEVAILGKLLYDRREETWACLVMAWAAAPGWNAVRHRPYSAGCLLMAQVWRLRQRTLWMRDAHDRCCCSTTCLPSATTCCPVRTARAPTATGTAQDEHC